MSNTGERIKLIISDTDRAYASMMSSELSSQGFVCEMSDADGKRILEKINHFHPDAVVAPFYLEAMDVVEVMNSLECELGHKPLFVVTDPCYNEMTYKLAAHAGAVGYFIKSCCIGALGDRIRQLIYCMEEQQSGNMPSVDNTLSRLFAQLGIPSHIKGCAYLKSGILLAIQDDGIVKRMVSDLYPTIAREFGTTPASVERSMRHAITIAWDRGDLEFINELFGHTVSDKKGKPTNAEFISLIASRLKAPYNSLWG